MYLSVSKSRLVPHTAQLQLCDTVLRYAVICCVPCCRCDKITISPQLLSELQSSTDPLPRKLSPDMTHSQDSKVGSFSADVFDSLHGGDQMAVDKLKQVGVVLKLQTFCTGFLNQAC